jgi:hypothetical protein
MLDLASRHAHRFTVCRRDDSDDWTLDSDGEAADHGFPTLPAALDYAREASDAEPSTIEIWVDGFYICVHEEQGWPRQICPPEARSRLT